MQNFKDYRRFKNEEVNEEIVTRSQLMKDTEEMDSEELEAGDEVTMNIDTKIPLEISTDSEGETGPSIPTNGLEDMEPPKPDENLNEVAGCVRTLLNGIPQMKFIHWHTTSYAIHMASDKTLDSYSDILDDLVEVYQGYYGRLPLAGESSIEEYHETEAIMNWVDSMIEIAEKIRSLAPETDIHNIIDELRATLAKFKYLLTLK